MSDELSIQAQRYAYHDELVLLSDEKLKAKYKEVMLKTAPSYMKRDAIITRLVSEKFRGWAFWEVHK
jgi:hypothetical protein